MKDSTTEEMGAPLATPIQDSANFSSLPPPVSRVTHRHDLTTGKVASIVTAILHDGSKTELRMARSALRSPQSVTKALDDAGANLLRPIEKGEAAILLEMTAENTRLERSQTGWVDRKFAFPLRKQIAPGGNVFFAAQTSVDPHLHSFYSKSGSSKAWWANVGPLVRQSDYAITGIGVILAAPLMKFSPLTEGAIFNMSGGSGGGKTSLALIAQSVMGRCKPGDILAWDSTLAGMEGVLGCSKDVALIIDDQEKGKAADRLAAAQGAGRLTADGGRRRRAASYEAEHGAVAQRAPRIGLSSSEATLLAEALERGVKVKLGSLVRLIDIPVPDRDNGGILNRRPKGLSDKQARKLVSKTIKGLEQNHGWAFRRFLKYLEANSDVVGSNLQKLMSRFCSSARKRQPELGSDGAMARILDKFALVFAALCLGARAGVFDLDEDRLDKAVFTCFAAASRALASGASEIARATETLRKTLGDPQVMLEAKEVDGTGGARPFRRTQRGVTTAYVPSAMLTELAGVDVSLKRVLLDHLKQLGAIADGHGARSKTVKLAGRNIRFLAFKDSFWGSRVAAEATPAIRAK